MGGPRSELKAGQQKAMGRVKRNNRGSLELGAILLVTRI